MLYGRQKSFSSSYEEVIYCKYCSNSAYRSLSKLFALSLQLIELKFEKFDVERDNYCRYDYVAVFNGGEINDAKRIGKYCGDSPPG